MIARANETEFGLSAVDMQAVYFNSPVHYLAKIEDPWYLDRYRRGGRFSARHA